MKKIALLILAMALLIPLPSEARTIVVAQDATWPPMEYLNESGEIMGFDTDFMRAVAREAGFDVVFKNMPWKEIFTGLDTGSYDAVCSSVTITEQRMRQVDFSVPYFWDKHVRQVMVVRKTTPVNNLEEMRGKVVGAQDGTTGYLAALRMQSLVTKPYDEIAQAFQDLLGGHIDGVICDDPVASRFLAQNVKSADKLDIVGLSDSQDEYYGVAVKKGNREVLDLINKGIESTQAKGIDIELRKKWMGE